MGSLIGAISSQKVTFSVALLVGNDEQAIWLYAGTPEYLTLLTQVSDNVLSAGNQQERLVHHLIRGVCENPQRLYARRLTTNSPVR